MVVGLKFSVSRDGLELVSTPHGMELQRAGVVTGSLFDSATLSEWGCDKKRSTSEKHALWLWRQGRTLCATCGVVHYGSQSESCPA